MKTKLTRREKAAINRLEKLADFWPHTLTLFSSNGSLLVASNKTGEVVENIGNTKIPNDGGCLDFTCIDGNEYADIILETIQKGKDADCES